ncbi:BTB/POZ protein [Dichotomocladium elegans]|nr:BTB/POZ protein [Dichotomocladium elegans]
MRDWWLIKDTFQSEREDLIKKLTQKFDDLRQKEMDLENSYQNFSRHVEHDFREVYNKLVEYQERLEKRKEEYGLEEKFMGEIKKIQNNKVKLNVGGRIFYTSTITLNKVPGNLLAKIVTEHEPEVDGAWFIDRDNTHFSLILNFLRDNELPQYVREDPEIMDELLQEAEYYGIHDLTSLRWTELPRVTQEELETLYPHPSSRKKDTVFILERKDLSGLDFSGYNISPRSSFHGSNLERANFAEAHFVFEFESQVNFTYCCLKGTMLPEEGTSYRSPGVYFNLTDADKDEIIYTSY